MDTQDILGYLAQRSVYDQINCINEIVANSENGHKWEGVNKEINDMEKNIIQLNELIVRQNKQNQDEIAEKDKVADLKESSEKSKADKAGEMKKIIEVKKTIESLNEIATQKDYKIKNDVVEIEMINDTIDSKEEEVVEWKKKVTALQLEVADLIESNRHYEKENREESMKMNEMERTIHQLKKIICEKDRQIQEGYVENDMLTGKKKEIEVVVKEKEDLSNDIQDKCNEIKDLKKKLDDVIGKQKQAEDVVEEAEKIITDLCKELSKINELYDEAKKAISSTEKSCNKELERIKKEFESLEKNNRLLKNEINLLKYEHGVQTITSINESKKGFRKSNNQSEMKQPLKSTKSEKEMTKVEDNKLSAKGEKNCLSKQCGLIGRLLRKLEPLAPPLGKVKKFIRIPKIKKSLAPISLDETKKKGTKGGKVQNVKVAIKKKLSFGRGTNRQNNIKHAKGLKNIGNTCFMNAVLQCIWVTLANQKIKRYGDNDMAIELGKLLRNMSTPGKVPISPYDFKHALARRYPQFRGNGQQDSHEFLLLLFENLSTEVAQLFTGNIISRVTCLACGHRSEKVEAFSVLDMEIPNSKCPTLSECIQAELSEDVITDGWSCHNCSTKNGAATKRSIIRESPSILVLQVKRFKLAPKGFVKNEAQIKLPTENIRVGDKLYDLAGVVNHRGVIDSGHYEATIRLGKDWKSCNDSKISGIRRMKDTTSEAYLLFLCESDQT